MPSSAARWVNPWVAQAASVRTQHRAPPVSTEGAGAPRQLCQHIIEHRESMLLAKAAGNDRGVGLRYRHGGA